MKYIITILISLMVVQFSSAISVNIHILITNESIDSALVNVSGSKQFVNLRKDSLSIKFKNKHERKIIKVCVVGYYPYFLKVNSKIDSYIITLSTVQLTNSIYNFTTRNNKSIHLGNCLNLLNKGNSYVSILNGQTLVIPVCIAESNALFFETLKMQINKYTSPLPEMLVEISIVQFNSNFNNNDLIKIYKDSINRIFQDTFSLTGNGNISYAINKEVQGCFFLLIKNIFNEELEKTYKHPILFGIKRRKLFNNNSLNHITIGYIKVADKYIMSDLELRTNNEQKDPISIELNLK